MAASSQTLEAMDRDTAEMGDSEPDEFELVINGKKSRKRKKRNFSIESLKAKEVESDSNASFVEAMTEPPSPRQNLGNSLKLLIVPIDKTKSLNKCSPLKIAKSVEKNAGKDQVKSIKHLRNGILVECRHSKQYFQKFKK